MRRAIPVEKRVATALWVLAHRGSYKQIGQRFGVGAATAREVLVEFALAMRKHLLPRTVYLGSVHEIMDGFAELGFPQVVGAVDGCRCLIVPPLRQREQSANRMDSYSILLQGTCDHTGRFVDVEIGGIHKARVICNSAIFKGMEAGTFVPGNPTITMCGQQIGPLLLSNSDHPIRTWLMKPYPGATNDKERLFNENLNRAKRVAEKAFSRLKARWRFLTAPLHVGKENLIPIIASCVVLHNLCETKGRVLDEGHHYRRNSELPTPRAPLVDDEDEKKREGEAVREALAQFFHTGRT
ncbi:protein ALP1-like isoform X2 [Sceloporus undulatus]|nr:protein ALP1-like isoform X2 [Sceloporus undulatus]XP_042300070.1 protein ALP1-like isoform X2 [Sceloporus undulatus]